MSIDGEVRWSCGKCEFKTFLPVFLSASFYKPQINQEVPRKSKVLGAPWIFLNPQGLLDFLVKAWGIGCLNIRISMKFQADS